jgi:hypothetical protein
VAHLDDPNSRERLEIHVHLPDRRPSLFLPRQD